MYQFTFSLPVEGKTKQTILLASTLQIGSCSHLSWSKLVPGVLQLRKGRQVRGSRVCGEIHCGMRLQYADLPTQLKEDALRPLATDKV